MYSANFLKIYFHELITFSKLFVQDMWVSFLEKKYFKNSATFKFLVDHSFNILSLNYVSEK